MTHNEFDERGLPRGMHLREDVEIAPADLSRRLQSDHSRPILVDCRRPDEWAIARIEGAIHIPMNELAARLDELAEHADEADLVVYCHHGVRSLKATLLLRQHGIEDVRSLAGGIDQWSLAIDPTVPRY